MKRDVIISITGNQAAPINDNVVKKISPGTYYKRNGKIYLRYEEINEKGEIEKNLVKIDDKVVEVNKSGILNFYMYFERDKKCVSAYKTPFGELSLVIVTDDVIVFEEKDKITVNIQYNLSVGYTGFSQNNVEIIVKPTD